MKEIVCCQKYVDCVVTSRDEINITKRTLNEIVSIHTIRSCRFSTSPRKHWPSEDSSALVKSSLFYQTLKVRRKESAKKPCYHLSGGFGGDASPKPQSNVHMNNIELVLNRPKKSNQPTAGQIHSLFHQDLFFF